MAGIGFNLRHLVDGERSLIGTLRGYAAATLVSSGPWVMTMASLWVATLFQDSIGHRSDFDEFRALVTYCFAFSLLVVGSLQMPLTRGLADLLFRQQYDAVLPAFVSALLAVGLIQLAVGGAYAFACGFDVRLTFVFCALFVVVGMSWIALVWLTCIRKFDAVLTAYGLGLLVSYAAMWTVDAKLGVTGAIGAYALGQAIALVLLVAAIVRGTEAPGRRDASIFKSLTRYPSLVLVGLAYSGAIWIDKIVFWFADGIGNHPFVRYHPLYDTCSFLAYITVLPALALNLIQVETSFYERYRDYYASVLGGARLGEIREKRAAMAEALREGGVRLLRVQGAITGACVVFAPWIIEQIAMPAAAVRVFQLACVGSGLHVFTLIGILILMYFDLRKDALTCAATFLCLNGVFAWVSLQLGVRSYGAGYALASLLALLLTLHLVTRALRELDYRTFISQPSRCS